MLTPYRGLFEILVIALFNPKIKIRVRGYSFAKHRIWRPIKSSLRYAGWKDNQVFSLLFSFASIFVGTLRLLPNIDFSKKPFPNERDFNYAMSSSNRYLMLPKIKT